MSNENPAQGAPQLSPVHSNGSVLSPAVSKVLLPPQGASKAGDRHPSFAGDPTTAVDMGNISTSTIHMKAAPTASVSLGPGEHVATAGNSPARRSIPRSLLSDQDSDANSDMYIRRRSSEPGVDSNASGVHPSGGFSGHFGAVGAVGAAAAAEATDDSHDEDGGAAADDDDDYDDEEDLHNILNDLIRQEPQALYTTASQALAQPAAAASAPAGGGQAAGQSGRSAVPAAAPPSTILDYKIFPDLAGGPDAATEAEVIQRSINVSKSSSSAEFRDKFKHVFILSSAGKPIYSLHGSDEIIIGYMGLITTIVSAFEEGRTREDIRSITYNGSKIVVMNRSPLILIAITRIGYEKMQLRLGGRRGGGSAASSSSSISNGHGSHAGGDDSILSRQLETLYDYLLSMISKPTITKSFQNRMNYDLRKILSPLDFKNLDSIVMKITYGVADLGDAPAASEDAAQVAPPKLDPSAGFGTFVSELLDSALECVRLTNTTRTKLNSILLSSKKLKTKAAEESAGGAFSGLTDSIPFFKGSSESSTGSSAAASYAAPGSASAGSAGSGPSVGAAAAGQSPSGAVAEDLLFSLLLDARCKVMAAMKPKHHNLKNEDIKILLSTIANQQQLTRSKKSEDDMLDLWIPICMPHFNSNGFLYAFIKTIAIHAPADTPAGPKDATSESPIPLTIVLLSGNKNSFFSMQEVASHLQYRLTKKSTSFAATLYRELGATTISIPRDIKVPQINHFIFKSKSSNQFVSSDIDDFSRGSSATSAILRLVYFYSTLHNTRATPLSTESSAGAGASGGHRGSVIRDNADGEPGTASSVPPLASSGFSTASSTTSKNKKLTYIKYFSKNGANIIGFMLCSDTYEFYCLCDDHTITTQQLIAHTLKIIRWCEKSHKRLFIENSAIF